VGEYLVLLRCKVDDDTTQVGIQLKHGWTGLGGKEVTVGTTYIDGQDGWELVELGKVSIPPTGNRDSWATTGNKVQDYSIVIAAERISDAGTLDLDCIILIPSKHMIYIDGADTGVSGGIVYIENAPDGTRYILAKTQADRYGAVEYSFSDTWEYPVGGGLLVIAAQTASTHDLTDTAALAISLVPRWHTFRIS
jgi:hypothetical protein